MNYTFRQISQRIRDLAVHFPVVVVTGARQVGKTTLLRHLFPDADYVVFDPSIDIENARKDPDLFLQNHASTTLILDEIQYAPEVVGAIKRAVDRHKTPGRFLLTGSQQWQVMKKLSESLAGRAVITELDGFDLAEWRGEPSTQKGWLEDWLDDPAGFAGRFQGATAPPPPLPLYEILFRGALPEATTLPGPLLGDYHNSYLRTYVERDVRTLAGVEDLQQFGRFHRLLAALTAQEINHAQLGREIGVAGKTAKAWLAILLGTFQWHEVPAYEHNLIKKVTGRPKGYFGDTGLACAAQSIPSPAALGSHPLLGALFETLVVGEIRKQALRMTSPPRLHHWRNHNQAELDLLLQYNGRLFPLEIKLSSNPSGHDTRGMTAFRKSLPDDSPPPPGLVISCSPTVRTLNAFGDFTLPWHWSST
ncbi:MAG: ATP-binding protein [Kiritimatiellia bacterium]